MVNSFDKYKYSKSSDKDYKIETESAYVFKKENPNNNFEDFPINDLLSLQQELPKNTKKITKK